MAPLKVSYSYFLITPHFQLQEVQVWGPHALEAGVLATLWAWRGKSASCKWNKWAQGLRLWPLLQKGFSGNQQIASPRWSFCIPRAPIAFMIITKFITFLAPDPLWSWVCSSSKADSNWSPCFQSTYMIHFFFRWGGDFEGSYLIMSFLPPS